MTLPAVVCISIGVVFVLWVALFSRKRGWRMLPTLVPAIVFQAVLQFVSAILWWSLETTGSSLAWFVAYEIVCSLLIFRLIYRSQIRSKEKR